MPNAFVSRVLVVVDFCAKMAEGQAQKGAKTKTSAGQTCYAIFQNSYLLIHLSAAAPFPLLV